MFKRIKNPSTNNYQIKCPCGCLFNARGDNAETVTVGVDEGFDVIYFYQWVCPACGQRFEEEIAPAIKLESIEEEKIARIEQIRLTKERDGK